MEVPFVAIRTFGGLKQILISASSPQNNFGCDDRDFAISTHIMPPECVCANTCEYLRLRIFEALSEGAYM